MKLTQISLQNFRNYKKYSLQLDLLTILIGRNTAGKTNILESIYFLSNGESFRAENDKDTLRVGEEFGRIEGKIQDEDREITLSVILAMKNGMFHKKYQVNGVPKRQNDFVSKFSTVIFTPTDVDIITGSPNLRRKYLDSVLSQASASYRLSRQLYEKALKQRNRMLYFIKEGKRVARVEEFEYWNELLMQHGTIITREREDLIAYFNGTLKTAFDFTIQYDKSTVTMERFKKYFEIEQKTGVTLIGPQRDELFFYFPDSEQPIKEFGSRGQQRLTILQMKLLEIEYLKQRTGKFPVLLLDDVFSELDNQNIDKLLQTTQNQQTIITTTHEEFIPKSLLPKISIVMVGNHM